MARQVDHGRSIRLATLRREAQEIHNKPIKSPKHVEGRVSAFENTMPEFVRAGGPVSADAIASFLVAVIIGVGALRLLKDAIVVLLEAAPEHLPVPAMRKAILGFPGVAEVHDMHVWTLGAGHEAVAVHIHADGSEPQLGSKLARHLRETYRIEYVTVQVEQPAEACDAPPSLFIEETD